MKVSAISTVAGMGPGPLVRALERRARFHAGLPPRKVRVTFGDRDLLIFEGTVRSGADKDSAWTQALCQRAREVLDVGANIGQTAVLAFCSGVERVVAVEAEPSALMMCVENVVTNFAGACFAPVLCFASDRDEGTTRLFRYRYGAANSMFSSHAETASRRGDVIEVPNRRLDSVARDHRLQPDLIKIDIEGAEGFALDGARNLTREASSRFLVEMHSSPELSIVENTQRVLDWCNDVGYSAFYLTEHRQLTVASDVSNRGRYHLFLQPKANAYPEFLSKIPQGADLDPASAPRFKAAPSAKARG